MGFTGNEFFPNDALIEEEQIFAELLDGENRDEPQPSTSTRNVEAVVADDPYSQGTFL